MEENQNEDQFLDKYTKDSVEKGITELLEEKELKIKWRRELAENESVQRFLIFNSFSSNNSVMPFATLSLVYLSKNWSSF